MPVQRLASVEAVWSKRMEPRRTLIWPVAVFATAVGARVRTPSPVFWNAKVPAPTPFSIRPLKVVLALSMPLTKVTAVALTLVSVPAPRREPTRVSKPLSEKTAPLLIVNGANAGVARVAPIRKVPAETTSGPEKEEMAEESRRVPAPSFVMP